MERFEALVTDARQRWWKQLVNVAYSITRDRHGAEDATQEAFAALVHTLQRRPEPTNVRAWLMTTTRRKALDWVSGRTRRWEHEVEPTHLSHDEGSEGWEVIAGPDDTEATVVGSFAEAEIVAVVERVESQSPGRTGLIRLVSLGYSVTDIANQRGEEMVTVMYRLARLRARIRDELNGTKRTPTQRVMPPTTKGSAWYEEAQALREQGWAVKAIAHHMGKSMRSVFNALSA
jgi:RNA polymerase sigma factor (sigma-70 family)